MVWPDGAGCPNLLMTEPMKMGSRVKCQGGEYDSTLDPHREGSQAYTPKALPSENGSPTSAFALLVQ